MQIIDSFYIVGIAIETTNLNGSAAKDLGILWERFYTEDISSKISTKVSDDIYSIYTDYEADHTGKYTCIIGHKVHSLVSIPKGFVGRKINAGNYYKFIAKGEMPSAVLATWETIWKSESSLNRKYTSDFEVYRIKSQNGANSEVEIYIATE